MPAGQDPGPRLRSAVGTPERRFQKSGRLPQGQDRARQPCPHRRLERILACGAERLRPHRHRAVQTGPASSQALPLGPYHAVQPEALPAGNSPYRREQTPQALCGRVQLQAQPKNHGLSLPSNLPLDVVKLDRSLTANFDRDKERRAMFAATIALAKEAGLTAVAVGIETNRQLALARELECAVGQGFLLQIPASPEEVRLRDTVGSVTSAPWRPLVRLGSSNRRLSTTRSASTRRVPRPGLRQRWSRTGCDWAWAAARPSRTCFPQSPSAATPACAASQPLRPPLRLRALSASWCSLSTRWASWTWRSTVRIRSTSRGGSSRAAAAHTRARRSWPRPPGASW